MIRKKFCHKIIASAFAVLVFAWMGQGAVAQGSEPVQIHLDHWANGGKVKSAQEWVDGNLHKTNSTYQEGDFIPTRFVMDNLPPGSYSLTFEWLAAKAQGSPGKDRVKHAHDYLATFNQYAKAGYGAGLDPCLPRVQGGGNGPNVCALGNLGGDSFAAVPADPYLLGGGFVGSQAAGQFRMWNGTLVNVSTYDYDPPAGPGGQPNFQATTTNRLTIINFQVGVGDKKDVVLALGARLAVANDWDSTVDNDSNANNEKDGACDISGAPYHWAYQLVDAEGNKLQSGSRDRSIMCANSGGGTGTITVAKRCFVGATEVFVDPSGADIPFEYSSATIGPLIGNDGDNYFDVVCGSNVSTEIDSGTHSVKESLLGQQNEGFGWELRNIQCSGTNTGGNASTYKYLDATVSPTDGFEIGDRTAQINLRNGDEVTCTFFNYHAEMPLHKLVNGESATCSQDEAGTTPNAEPGDDSGFRPCTYENAELTLEAGDPRFTQNLYLADSSDPVTGRPTGFPDSYLASVVIPPRFDAQGLIGIPLSICEMNIPNGWKLNDVTIEITLTGETTPSTTLNYTPDSVEHPIYDPAPDSANRCFNILIPSDTEKFEIFINNKPFAHLRVIKSLIPSDDPGLFLLQINGTAYENGVEDSSGVGDGGTTGWIEVLALPGGSSYAVSEAAVSPADLANYASSLSCSPRSATNNTGTSGDVELFPADEETCTIVNKRKPELKLVKNLIPSDDPGRFDLNIGGGDPEATDVGDGGETPFVVVDFGSVAVSEAGSGGTDLSNYIMSISCTAGVVSGSGPNWSVDLSNVAPGTQVTCTISNFAKSCSYTQGAWFAPPNGNNPATILKQYFSSVYGGGLVVGGTRYVKFTTSNAVSLAKPGGTPGILGSASPYINPTDFADTGSGNFGSQVTALKINVDLGGAGLLQHPGIGGLTFGGLSGPNAYYNGKTVADLLADAQAALGNDGLPAGYTALGGTINSLTGFLGDNVNPSWDECRPTDWALEHYQ